MFSFGIPSSFSVYTRFFFLVGAADLVFCCLGGGAFGFFEALDFVFAPRAPGLPEPLEFLPSFVKDLDLTVLVGAMTYQSTCRYFRTTCTQFGHCKKGANR